MSTPGNKSPFAGAGFGGAGFAGSAGGGVRPMSNPHKDPFEDLGEPTGELEEDSREEVEALSDSMKGFRQRMKNESSRFDYAVDAGFWAGVCFKSTDDLEAFLNALAPLNLYRGHIDGYELAEKFGLEVEWSDRGK